MVYKIALSVSVLLFAVCCWAQTAEDFFHRGAQLYIFNKKPEAKAEIGAGLRLFPQDPKLNAMENLLKKEEQERKQQQHQNQNSQQQNQNNQQQQRQNQQQAQQNQSQQKKDSSQQDQQQQAQQRKQDQQQQQAAQKAQEQQKPPQPQPQQAAGEKKENQEKNGDQDKAYAANQMTPEQARQLLDSEKGDEMMLQLKPEGKPVDPNKPIKDW